MNVMKIIESDAIKPCLKPSNDDLQNEYSYILAESITKRLLDEGLINTDEYEKIMEKNKNAFSPLFSRI